jgi:peptide/nickel transport system permease protein
MAVYALKRLLLFIPTLVMVSFVIFGVMRIIPGDPALLVLVGDQGEGSYTQEEYDAVKARLGLDKSLGEQYGRWMWRVIKLDFGASFFYYNVTVADELKVRIPITGQLAIMAMLMSFVIAVPLGVLSAVKQDTWFDYVAKVVTISGVALPTFWVGILMVFFLSRYFDYLPPLGYVDLWENPWVNLQQMIFPALALAFNNTAFTARVTRSSMLEVLREDYIRTARSKGLVEMAVVFRHALKNAFLPVITVSAWQFSRLIGGAVLIEVIFQVPGVGRLLIESTLRRDLDFVQSIILVTAGLVLMVNLTTDLAYGWLNPRVRYA